MHYVERSANRSADLSNHRLHRPATIYRRAFTIVQGQFNLEPFSTALFLFCGRRRDRIKGLLWEGDGFLLLYNRLDNGSFRWSRSEMEEKLLSPQQTRWLLEGLKIEQPKAIREGIPGALY